MRGECSTRTPTNNCRTSTTGTVCGAVAHVPPPFPHYPLVNMFVGVSTCATITKLPSSSHTYFGRHITGPTNPKKHFEHKSGPSAAIPCPPSFPQRIRSLPAASSTRSWSYRQHHGSNRFGRIFWLSDRILRAHSVHGPDYVRGMSAIMVFKLPLLFSNCGTLHLTAKGPGVSFEVILRTSTTVNRTLFIVRARR